MVSDLSLKSEEEASSENATSASRVHSQGHGDHSGWTGQAALLVPGGQTAPPGHLCASDGFMQECSELYPKAGSRMLVQVCAGTKVLGHVDLRV